MMDSHLPILPTFYFTNCKNALSFLRYLSVKLTQIFIVRDELFLCNIVMYLVLYIISNVLVFCIVDNKNLQCVSVETPNHPLSPPRLLLSNRGWAEPEPKLCARIEILVFVWRLLEIPAFRLQLSGRKPEEHPFTLNFLIRYTGRIYSSCFLPDSYFR